MSSSSSLHTSSKNNLIPSFHRALIKRFNNTIERKVFENLVKSEKSTPLKSQGLEIETKNNTNKESASDSHKTIDNKALTVNNIMKNAQVLSSKNVNSNFSLSSNKKPLNAFVFKRNQLQENIINLNDVEEVKQKLLSYCTSLSEYSLISFSRLSNPNQLITNIGISLHSLLYKITSNPFYKEPKIWENTKKIYTNPNKIIKDIIDFCMKIETLDSKEIKSIQKVKNKYLTGCDMIPRNVQSKVIPSKSILEIIVLLYNYTKV